MRKLYILSILTLCCATAFAQADKEIRQTFEAYKAAIMAEKGEAALQHVDSRTVRYYDGIIEMVKNGDSARIDGLSLVDKLTVLAVRHRATPMEIRTMDGKGLFIYAIKNGMIGKNSVNDNTIGKVTTEGGAGKGQLVVRGQQTPINFNFNKEENRWKLDLTSFFPMAAMAFEKMVKESGRPENEFIISLLEMMTSRKPVNIWSPVK